MFDSIRTIDTSRANKEQHPRPRRGKTRRDKENGHVAYRKNIREWTGDNPQDPKGEWVKRYS